MRVIILLSALFFSILISSCDKDVNPDDCIDIITDKDLYDNGPQGDDTVIDTISLSGNCIIVSLSYGGGCEEHDIKLVTDGLETLSNPPQRFFKIIHDDQDLCEALIHEDWMYDLGSLDNGVFEMVIEGYGKNILVEIN